MSADVATLEAGLIEVSRILGGFRAKLIEGELVDLQGVDSKVIGLCADIAELPPSERAEFEGQLNGLLRDLRQISDFLVEQSAAVDQAIQESGASATTG